MPYFYYFICLTFLFSCGRNPDKTQNKAETTVSASDLKQKETKYVNSIKITSPEKNSLHVLGEEIPVSFENKERFAIDSSCIYINGKEVAKLGKDVKNHMLQLPKDKVGAMTIKVVSWHPNNKKGTQTVKIYLKPSKAPQKYTFEIVKVFSHDKNAYTQGLQYYNGYMYEGTGQYGASSLRKVDMKNGDILSVINLEEEHFGEGITIHKDKIYQLTWHSRKGFVYNLENFTLESTFSYNTEGWGITTMEQQLVMSDGSNKLYFVDPTNFQVIKWIEVYDHNGMVEQLNELEYVNGLIWANVWLTDRIIAIDPNSGVVVAELDMSGLLTAADKKSLNDQDDVLNGIAWNASKNTFYVTGKRWPKLFEIKIRK
jgi:glutamine cyclotransferase